MTKAKRLEILVLAWVVFSAANLTALSRDRSGQPSPKTGPLSKAMKVVIAGEPGATTAGDSKQGKTPSAAVWQPTTSGREAYRERFESSRHAVVSRVSASVAPASPAMPKPFAPVPVARITNIAPGSMRVALTFDVEKDAGSVSAILAALKVANVKATFFVTGIWARAYPDLLGQIADGGHEIANHSFDHPMFTRITDENIISQMTSAEAQIYAATKRPPARLFRPPYGDCDSRVLGVTASRGFKTVLWSNDPNDWKTWQTSENVFALVTGNVTDGDIILMHSASQATGGAMPGILEKLKSMGFSMVTVGQLVGG